MIDHSDSTPDVAFTYDPNGNRISMSDDGTAGAEVTYACDELNSLESVSRGASNFSYLYFPDGTLKKRTYPNGAQTAYTYDGDNRLDTVTTGGKIIDYDYDVASGKIIRTLPSTNGYVETTFLDRAGRITKVTNKKGTTTLSKFDYGQFDGVGNPGQLITQDETITYTYDDAYRLTLVCYSPDCTGSGLTRIDYSYDPVGNLEHKSTFTSGQTSTTSYTYDDADQIINSGYTYDDRGNLAANPNRTFSYDLANRLLSTSNGSVSYACSYDGDGSRLTSSKDGVATNLAWDINSAVPLLATESDASGQVLRRYTYGAGIESLHDGAFHYLLTDGMGSVANLVSANGTTVEGTYTYEPYGMVRSQPSSGIGKDNPMRFQGEFRDGHGGYDLRAREYWPATGSFLQRDPAATALSDPVVSSYLFGAGNPVANADPTGLFDICGGVFCGEVWSEMWRNPIASWKAAPSWSKWVAAGSLAVAATAGVVACALSTAGICASFTVFGLGNTAAGSTACVQVCDDAGNLVDDLAGLPVGGVPERITGYTWHGLQQVIGRDGTGVAARALLDAVRSPSGVAWQQPSSTWLFTGKDAVVVLNDAGRLVTAWPTNSAGWRL